MPERSAFSTDVDAGTNRAKRVARLSVVLAGVLLFHTCWNLWDFASNAPMIDFFGFWSVPHVLATKPESNVYSPDVQRDIASTVTREAQSTNVPDIQKTATAATNQLYEDRVDVTGSPLLYSLVGAMSSGSYATDHHRYLFVVLTCAIASVAILCAVLQYSGIAALLVLIFVLTSFAPFVSDVQVGNVNAVQLFGLALFVLFFSREAPVAAGLALGATTAFKPTTALVVVVLVIAMAVDRQYPVLRRVLVGWCGAIGVGIAGSAVYFGGVSVWRDFVLSLPRTLATSYPIENGNFSLVASTAAPQSGAGVVVLVVLVGAFCGVVLRTRRAESDRQPGSSFDRGRFACAVAGAGCATTVLASPLAWLHYYVLMLPLLLYVLAPGATGERGWADTSVGQVARVIPLVLFSTVVNPLLNGEASRVASVVNFASIVAFLMALHQLYSERSGVAAHQAASVSGSKVGARAKRSR